MNNNNETPTPMTQSSMNKRRKILLGIASGSAVAAWHKPMINQVITPAHAQTSPVDPPPLPTPQELCPMITTGNVVFGPVSGNNTPPVCTATFDVLSGDSAVPLDIISIETGTLPADTTVDIQDLGTATDSMGPRVVWQGPATDAPFCSDLMPIDDITFTITATCDAVNSQDTDGDTFTQEFMLSEILMP